VPANYRFRESLHFFELRAELQQNEIDAGGFELRHALRDLFGCAHEAGTQSAVRNE